MVLLFSPLPIPYFHLQYLNHPMAPLTSPSVFSTSVSRWHSLPSSTVLQLPDPLCPPSSCAGDSSLRLTYTLSSLPYSWAAQHPGISCHTAWHWEPRAPTHSSIFLILIPQLYRDQPSVVPSLPCWLMGKQEPSSVSDSSLSLLVAHHSHSSRPSSITIYPPTSAFCATIEATPLHLSQKKTFIPLSPCQPPYTYMIWYDMIWYDLIWRDMSWCDIYTLDFSPFINFL
jgi:hypothetical protein